MAATSQLQTSEAPANIDPARTVIGTGEDKLEICRVINGMWQTSGGWGKIEPPKAVDAMLRHVDSGFTTFDMADICMYVGSLAEHRSREHMYAGTVAHYPACDGVYDRRSS